MVHFGEELVFTNQERDRLNDETTGKPALVLMAGLPGAGKSTLARAIGSTFGWPVIDKDVIVSSLLDGGIDEPVAQPASYAAMFALGLDFFMSQRWSVILDNPAGRPLSTSEAQRIADTAGATLVCILCLADRDTRNARVADRSALRSQPVCVSQTTGDGRERFAHLPADTIAVDMTQPLHKALREVVQRLTTILRQSRQAYPHRYSS